jgi:hypothetical protein
MTLKEFLETNTITSVDVVDGFNLIINVYVEEVIYGLRVDTANIPAGTSLTKREDFVLTNDTLSVDAIIVDAATTKMLG